MERDTARSSAVRPLLERLGLAPDPPRAPLAPFDALVASS
jgi:hypothetical protein